jgi:hypothetical protein
MTLGRCHSKPACSPAACPENPSISVSVCPYNTTGFFAQILPGFAGVSSVSSPVSGNTCFSADLLRLSGKIKQSPDGTNKTHGRCGAVGRPAGSGAMASRLIRRTRGPGPSSRRSSRHGHAVPLRPGETAARLGARQRHTVQRLWDAPRSRTSERTRAPGQDTTEVRWLCAPWVHASVPPCPGGGLPRHASPGGLVAGA